MDKDHPFTQRVYIIVMVDMQSFGPSSIMPSLEPVGVCSNLKIALDYIMLLEDALPESEESVFDVFEFNINSKPIMLELLKIQQEDVENAISNSLIDLMGKGMVDQLIGEDGNFYYTLTELGKKTQEAIPDKIKKFFKRKKK